MKPLVLLFGSGRHINPKQALNVWKRQGPLRGVGRGCALGRECLFPQPQQVASFYCSRPFRPFFSPGFNWSRPEWLVVPVWAVCAPEISPGSSSQCSDVITKYNFLQHTSQSPLSLSLTCCCSKSLENNMCCNNFSIVSLPSTIVPLN